MSAKPVKPLGTDGYERADARPRAIGIAVLVLLAVVVGTFVLAGELDRGWTASAERASDDPHPMAGARRPPTAALLQSDPRAHFEVWDAEQRELGASYGWIDREAGVVRIPVGRAMELLVERAAKEER